MRLDRLTVRRVGAVVGCAAFIAAGSVIFATSATSQTMSTDSSAIDIVSPETTSTYVKRAEPGDAVPGNPAGRNGDIDGPTG